MRYVVVTLVLLGLLPLMSDAQVLGEVLQGSEIPAPFILRPTTFFTNRYPCKQTLMELDQAMLEKCYMMCFHDSFCKAVKVRADQCEITQNTLALFEYELYHFVKEPIGKAAGSNNELAEKTGK